MRLSLSDDDLVARFGVSRESVASMRIYHDLLLKWQKALNLVSSGSVSEAWERHFIDSLQVLSLVPDDVRSLVDLGSGGGFPGMVLAIARSNLDVHLVDSDQRKVQFLKTVSRETSAPVSVYAERVEKITENLVVDLVTARGFAPLIKIFEWTQNLAEAQPELRYLLLKGARVEEEIVEAQAQFSFDVERYSSITSADSFILLISNVRKLR
jgi:16S rRNA (guanine527-N7)-methyltransferase